MVKYIGNESKLSGWLAAEKALKAQKSEPVPRGWITVQDYTDSCFPKLSRIRARARLGKLFKEGFTERSYISHGGKRIAIYCLTHAHHSKR